MNLPLTVQNYCFEITYVILMMRFGLQLSITYTLINFLWLSTTKMSISPKLPFLPTVEQSLGNFSSCPPAVRLAINVVWFCECVLY